MDTFRTFRIGGLVSIGGLERGLLYANQNATIWVILTTEVHQNLILAWASVREAHNTSDPTVRSGSWKNEQEIKKSG